MSMSDEVKLTGMEKAAVFVLSLPDDESKKLLEGMEDEEMRSLSRTIAQMGAMPPETVQGIREEFIDQFENYQIQVRGGLTQVKDLVTRVLGKDKGRALLHELQKGTKTSPWEILNEMEPTLVATFFSNEHPQAVALALSQMQSEQASFVLDFLSAELQQQVVFRMAKMSNLPPGAMDDIEESLLTELRGMGAARTVYSFESGGGVKKVADLLNNLGRETSDRLMAYIDEEDNAMAEEVRKEMFLFEDLMLMDDKSFQVLLRDVGNDELMTSLKGADERLREKFFNNMSERAAEMLREELELMGPTKVSDVETAQQSILKVARQLESEGSIVIMGKGAQDVVV